MMPLGFSKEPYPRFYSHIIILQYSPPMVVFNTILYSKVNVMGMVKKSITLTEQQNEWLQSQLSVGKYASDSELLRDLIRKEQARHDEVNAIREALVAAEKSGLSKRTPADIMADVLANRSISGQL